MSQRWENFSNVTSPKKLQITQQRKVLANVCLIQLWLNCAWMQITAIDNFVFSYPASCSHKQHLKGREARVWRIEKLLANSLLITVSLLVSPHWKRKKDLNYLRIWISGALFLSTNLLSECLQCVPHYFWFKDSISKHHAHMYVVVMVMGLGVGGVGDRESHWTPEIY